MGLALSFLFSSMGSEVSLKQGVPTKDEGEGEGVAGNSGRMEGCCSGVVAEMEEVMSMAKGGGDSLAFRLANRGSSAGMMIPDEEELLRRSGMKAPRFHLKWFGSREESCQGLRKLLHPSELMV